jgi:flavin-dependent dehydrogenase
MDHPSYDVVIVGAGCAGMTAAFGLAREGFSVVVVESAAEVGISGSLGDVCFSESLAEPDLFGVDGVRELAWERRLIERGGFITDGRKIAGNVYRDADAFRNCYTVLRSRFDASLADRVLQRGVEIKTHTTVASLIREGRRIVGVATSQAPIYAKLTFLAEGDAGYLIAREGLERFPDSRDNPGFLYCLQQVVDLPSGEVERRFQLEADEAVAYDFLLRNPGNSRRNARGMLWCNRRGLTASVVLPVENLLRGFHGEPYQFLDWFVNMPALLPWLRDGERGAWSVSLLRVGGWRDVPYLVEDGLAVGGAAAGLGFDFPVVNSMGPAITTGFVLSRAARAIRAEGREFDRESLLRHYLEPLQQTRYWRNVDFFHRWPSYLRRTRVLCDSGLDLLLDSSAIWSRTNQWLPGKLFSWLDVLARVSWGRWGRLRDDLGQLGRALRLREVTPRPALTRLLLDGALNAFRDIARSPRPHLPPGGALRLYFHSAGEAGRASAVPRTLRRWFERFRPVWASAAHGLYVNDETPLSEKLTRTINVFIKQINLFDLVAVAALAAPLAFMGTVLSLWRYAFGRVRRPRLGIETAKKEGAESLLLPITRPHVVRELPLIHILWRSAQPSQQAAAVQDLPNLCPGGVFEIEGSPPTGLRVVVRPERCVYCEACWRLNPHVDWVRGDLPNVASARESQKPSGELEILLEMLETKLRVFEEALREGPSMVDRPHNDYLEMLARFSHQLTIRILEVIKQQYGAAESGRSARAIAADLVARAGERTRRVWEGRFAWAIADGTLLRQHHVSQLRRLLSLPTGPSRTSSNDERTAKPGGIASIAFPIGTERLPIDLDAVGIHLLADIAARHYLLEELADDPFPSTDPIRRELLSAFLDEQRNRLTEQIAEWDVLLGKGVGVSRNDNSLLFITRYRRYGHDLFADIETTRRLLDIPGDWTTLEQRLVLRSERQELWESENRLIELARDWVSSGRIESADDEIFVGFARQAAYLLAGKQLLLRTFARIEDDVDAELAMLLLRVWLDNAATDLDEYSILVRTRLRPPPRSGDRPLVEPGLAAPLRTQTEYLAASASYASGDFLLLPIDLLQPRLFPEMGDRALVDLKSFVNIKDGIYGLSDINASLEKLYLAEAMTVEMSGRRMHAPSHDFILEEACIRLVLSELFRSSQPLGERCNILRALSREVLPRWVQQAGASKTTNLERDILELESLKIDFRKRMTATWHVFGEALGCDPDVQASCFALAEATAWLKAADSALARIAWISRLCQADDCEEPAAQQELGHRALAYCFAEVRDRLFRFEGDLAALRRGYYVPHVHAAKLMLYRRAHRHDAT